MAGGTSHSVAVKQDGTVWAWGGNASGQLGTNTTNQSSPVQVSGLNGFTQVAAGDAFSMGLKSDGSVWTWGSNSNGQLGDNTTINRLSPVQVVGLGGTGTLSGIVAIAAGRTHALALSTTGVPLRVGQQQPGRAGRRHDHPAHRADPGQWPDRSKCPVGNRTRRTRVALDTTCTNEPIDLRQRQSVHGLSRCATGERTVERISLRAGTS